MLDAKIAQLNPSQKQVVAHSTANHGPLLVLAGAGSGKTTVLTLRVAKRIDQGQNPEGIYCLTFSAQAALEMKERLHKLLPEQQQYPWMGTFHSLAYTIVKENCNWSKLAYHSPPLVWDKQDWLKQMQTHFDPEQWIHIDREYLDFIADSQIPKPPNCSSILWDELCHLSQKLGLEQGKIHFGEMLRGAIHLFEFYPHILKDWQGRIQELLVDEYQDIDPQQYQFCRLLLGEQSSFIAVGDDDQAIYSFRGSSPQCILQFRQDFPNCSIVKLEDNYRSTAVILQVANQIFSDKDLIYRKILRPNTRFKSPIPSLVRTLKFPSAWEEITWINQKIKSLLDLGIPAAQIAILGRYNRLIDFYRSALKYHGFENRNMDQIVVQTLHGSKGLEYRIVFYIGLSKGLSPGHGENPEEEKRLFYVGVTRAQEQLYLLHSRQRVFRDKDQSFEPSPFLQYHRLGLGRKMVDLLWN